MRNKRNLNGGYMLLLLITIGLVVIAFFIFGTNIFYGTKDEKVIEEENFSKIYKFDPEAEEKKVDSLN